MKKERSEDGPGAPRKRTTFEWSASHDALIYI